MLKNQVSAIIFDYTEGFRINQLEKDTCKSTALAVASFIKENNLIEDKVSITPINKKKVILRSYLWSIDDNRSAEKTIYHGEDYD